MIVRSGALTRAGSGAVAGTVISCQDRPQYVRMLQGRACVLVINKWDTVKDKTSTTVDDYKKEVLACLRPVSWAKLVFTSAVTGQRVQNILQAATDAGEEHARRISTATLNMVLQEIVSFRSPPSGANGKRGRLYYITQAATRPPSFVLFVNDAKLFLPDYRQYVERQIRANIGFPGTPIRIFWRGKEPKGRT